MLHGRPFLRSVLTVVLLIGFLAAIARADDWPQWRGPTRDGVWRETGIIERFENERIPLKWRMEIGPGYSGPTVADGRVFVTDRQTEPRQVERVHAFDSKSGMKLWTYAYDCQYKNVGYTAGPRASVTVDDGRAYVLGTMGHLHCFDAGSGALLWKKTPGIDYEIDMPIWGIAAAPLVVDDLLIVQIGGKDGACVIALHKKDGDVQWKALRDRAGYSAPILIEQAHREVVVLWTGDNVVGLDPQSGKVYWRTPFTPSRMVINVPTPVFDGNRLFVSAFYDGALMMRLPQDSLTVERLWRESGDNERDTRALHCMISTPILLGDYIYGVDSYGQLRCLDAATGRRIWQDLSATPPARWSNIHIVQGGENIWMFNERGELIICRLSPHGFHEISRAKLIDTTVDQLRKRAGRAELGVCWSHPAYADRHVFARNDKELVCASLEAD